MITLSNSFLTIAVSEHGAELHSLRTAEREYLWQADPVFWSRHSPVLFPIVGRVWNDVYRVDGVEYHLGQHGFARDRDFQLVSQTDDSVFFSLCDDEDSIAIYPCPFRLEIGYRLHGRSVDVIWRVSNPSHSVLDFQIGAHPAFYWPGFAGADNEPYTDDGILGFFRLSRHGAPVTGPLCRSTITEKGCVDPAASTEVPLCEGGILPLDFALFGRDALVLEDAQVDRVELLSADRAPYLTVDFDAPLVGLWSPPGKHAPFVCIEPWYGRCDSVRYDGEYRDKPWVNRLAPGSTFEVSYTITLH